MYRKYLKRILDFTLSLIALVVLSPIMVMVSILIKINIGSPIIFKQQRPGLNERIFTMYKFRTMSDKRDEFGLLLPDNQRMTKFGKLLRSTSLDELPELWNILKGDMSLVGPRPQLVLDMVFMTDCQRIRHCVLPGLTGLAQVNGRNNITWEEKINYDLLYINNVSFFYDLKILIKTFINVFTQDGISSEGMETAENLGDYLLRIERISIEEYEAKQSKVEILSK